MNACREFRSRLADLIAGHAPHASLGRLAWHEHLLGCNACRDLLQSEEALEILLSSLPEPHFPPELARRLLAVLEPARADAALDSLLDRSLDAPVPSHLARNTLDKLAAARRAANDEHQRSLVASQSSSLDAPDAREVALDRLLGSVPVPAVPAALAQRVLARLSVVRASTHVALPLRTAETARRASAPSLSATSSKTHVSTASSRAATHGASPSYRRLVLAAAVLVAALGVGAFVWSRFETAREGELDPKRGQMVDSTPIAPSSLLPLEPVAPMLSIDEPPEDLLASLDLLESWELLVDESLEVELVLEGYEVLLVDSVNDSGADGTPANDAAQPAREPAPATEPKTNG